MTATPEEFPIEPPPAKPRRRWFWRLFKLGLLLLLLLFLVLLFWSRRALYHHFVTFPREAAAWQALRAERQPVKENAGWEEYRGILHSHSHFSHDSEMQFKDIWQAMNVARLDFICMSDHCVNGRGDFTWQWRGLHDGKLFIPGFEMNNGIMPFGVTAGVVLTNSTPGPELARQIVANGGVLFYAHPEEPRDWERPELTGMEIYNIHADFKRMPGGPLQLLPEVALNLHAFPEHVYRKMFIRPTEFLRHWDELNRTRHITGIAGNDCHQNVGLRLTYTTNGTLRIGDTSPKGDKEYQLNWLTRPMVRLLFGPLEPGRRLFYVQLDPYERSARFVNTHVLARGLNEAAVLEALRAGRVFIGFDMVADSSGFRWFARDTTNTTVMGESAPLNGEVKLQAVSPLPCRFTIVKDGAPAHQSEGRSVEWTPTGPGKYRVEAEVKIRNEWTPWVYANPIELR